MNGSALAPPLSMIIASYHDFRSLRRVICPVCPAQTRDITSSGGRGRAATDGGGRRAAVGVRRRAGRRLAGVGRHGKLGGMSDPDPREGVAAPEDPACAVAHGHEEASADAIAHGHAEAPVTERTIIAVFASPVARFLLRYARDAGFRPVLVEPDAERVLAGDDGFAAARTLDGLASRDTDVVVTDHHRPELGDVLRDALASPARWVGVMGNPKHPAPHIPAL